MTARKHTKPKTTLPALSMAESVEDALELIDDLDEYDSLPSRSFSHATDAIHSGDMEDIVECAEEFTPKVPEPIAVVLGVEEPLTLFTKEEAKELVLVFDDDPVIDLSPTRTDEEPKKKLPRLTVEQKAFLVQYTRTGTVTQALKNAKVTSARYKMWLTLPQFAIAFEDATNALADRLEGIAFQRAMAGSDKLLIKSLEALRPARWGKASTVRSFFEGKMDVDVKITDWAALAKEAEVIDVTPTRTALPTRTKEG